MKLNQLVKSSGIVAGLLAVASAFLIVVFILLAEFGCIHPRKVDLMLASKDVTSVYSGEMITGGLDILHGDLLPGHEIQVLSQSGLIEVGQIENVIEYKIVDDTGADVTERYNIRQSWGTITVEKRPIVLSSDSASKSCDGTPLSKPTFSVTSGSLIAGHSVSIANPAILLNVGEIRNTMDFYVMDADGRNVTEFYDVVSSYGQLSIRKIELRVVTETASKTYDGSALRNENYRISSGQLREGHELRVVDSPCLEGVGTMENRLGFCVIDAAGNDVTYWYDIQQNIGSLIVSARKLSIKTGSGSKAYDATPLSVDTYEVTSGSLTVGERIVIVGQTEFDGVGSADNVIRFVIRDSLGKDITDTYQITYVYGKLNVTPRTVSIEMGSAKKAYDGTPLTCSTYAMLQGSLCSNHVLTVVGRSRTDVGETYNDMISYKIMEMQADGTQKDVSHCYRVSYSSGKLTVTAPR